MSRHLWGEALCDNTKSGCVADFSKPSMKWKLFLGCRVAHAQTFLNAKNHEPLSHAHIELQNSCGMALLQINAHMLTLSHNLLWVRPTMPILTYENSWSCEILLRWYYH